MKKLGIGLILGFLLLQPLPAEAAIGNGPIIFVIDTSGSMKQGKLEAVKSAVKKIIVNLQPERKIGIISFSQKVTNVLSPTLDHKLAIKRVDSLFPGGDTSLYDALEQALQLQMMEHPSQIVLLSDGADTTSTLRLEQIIKDASQVGIPIAAIGVQVSAQERSTLENIATTSGGNYYGVNDISTLIATYSEILSEQLIPNATPTVKPDSGTNQKLGALQLNRSVYFEVLVATLVAILILLLFINLRDRKQNRKQRQARVKTLQKYSYRQARKARNRIKISIKTYSFVPPRIAAAIRNNMESVHSELSYESVVQLLIASWIFITFLLTLILHSIFLGMIVAGFALPLGFKGIIKGIQRKLKVRFAEELPDLLNILASALRAGLTLPQGLEAYSAETKNEVAREIRRSMSEIRVGTPVDEALMGVAERMDSDDLRWAVTALSIQRVVGGSMATILTTTYETVRARAEIRREVKTLAAEGKLSVYVLMALPIGIFAFLFLTRREYIQILWTDPAGILILGIITINLFVGWKWMKKIVEIKI